MTDNDSHNEEEACAHCPIISSIESLVLHLPQDYPRAEEGESNTVTCPQTRSIGRHLDRAKETSDNLEDNRVVGLKQKPGNWTKDARSRLYTVKASRKT